MREEVMTDKVCIHRRVCCTCSSCWTSDWSHRCIPEHPRSGKIPAASLSYPCPSDLL